ncbi:GNAT family N-acetyltransferase [soil metagenome]
MTEESAASLGLPEPIAGVAWRPLTLADAAPMTELLNASFRHDELPFVQTLEEVRHSMADQRLDPARDTIGGWSDDGQLVCFGAARARAAAVRRRIVYQDGEVHPAWRRRGLGGALLAWTEARSRQLLAQPLAADATTEPGAGGPAPAFLEVYANERQADRALLYERHGFRPIRWYVDMRRPLDQPLPAVELTAGLSMVEWSAERDDDYRVAHVTAFNDHWGSEPLTKDEWHTRFTGAPMFRPDLTVGVVDGEGRLVGYVIGYHAPEDTAVTGRVEGWLGQVGTLREWRGQRVASALMVHVMGRMRMAGFDDAMLDVDTDNSSGAVGLYERLGFRPQHRSVRWEKAAD